MEGGGVGMHTFTNLNEIRMIRIPYLNFRFSMIKRNLNALIGLSEEN